MKRYVLTFLLMTTLLCTLPAYASYEADWQWHELNRDALTDDLECVDFDLDGDLDLVRSHHNYPYIYWHRNDGTGSFQLEQTNPPYGNLENISIADMDGDGVQDIVFTFEHDLVVYIIQPSGGFLIVPVVENIPESRWNRVFDLDGDGDNDIISDYGDDVYWYENNLDGTYTSHLLPGMSTNHSTEAGDVDGDGDMDIVYYAYQIFTGYSFYWMENTGDMVFTEPQLIYNQGTIACLVTYEDENGFHVLLSLIDLRAIHSFTYNGNTWEEEDLVHHYLPEVMLILDLNGDNQDELVFMTHAPGSIGWLPLPNPDYDDVRYIMNTETAYGILTAGDLDGDGDIDLAGVVRVARNHYLYTLSWWENPEYRPGMGLSADVDPWGWVHLAWNGLGSDQFVVRRNGIPITVTSNTAHVDHVTVHGIYEYTILSAPPDGGPVKPSYPATVHFTDPDDVVLLEEFESGFPDSWTIEQYVVSGPNIGTWGATYSPMLPARNLFIGYHYPEEAEEEYDDFLGIAASPAIRVIQNTRVELSFQHVFRQSNRSTVSLLVSTDSLQTWNTVRTYVDGGMEFQHFDLTDFVTDADSMWIGFDGTGEGRFHAWAVDDVTVTMSVPPVVLTYAPVQTEIPVGGGTLVYDVHLESNLPSMMPNVRYWCEVELPDGSIHELASQVVFNLQPFEEITAIGQQLTVPAGAPPGYYQFRGFVGYQTDPNLQESSSFVFHKGGTIEARSYVFNPSEWISTDDFASANAVADSRLPGEFELSQPYPNPFNPTTTINVTLPETAPLTVRVFDIQGRTVVTLADGGSVTAGSHAFSFDGSKLSSGIYFVQATVPGQLNEVRKLMLVK